MKDLTLAYSNEDDRAYGLAGMAISLAALDALDNVAYASLDADGPMITFSTDYYFGGSPTVSPKAAWDNLLQKFYITSTMVIGNMMSRSLVRMKRDIPSDLLDELHKGIAEEGHETCSLDDDEVDDIFRRSLSYTRRIFGNPRLHPAVDEFVRVISRRRDLSGMEIRDELRLLNIL